jgi:glycerol uptake facilitator-like aquaporin
MYLRGCYIPPSTTPSKEDYRYIMIFAVAPICTAIIAILTVNTALVYWTAQKQMIAARKLY